MTVVVPSVPPTPNHFPGAMEVESESSPSSYANCSTSWTPAESATPISTAPSRKRSREEDTFDAAEAETSYFSFPWAQPVNTPAPIPEEEPIFREGMTLLNPQTGAALPVESQTGTWHEEKEEAEKQRKASASRAEARPVMSLGRKSMRLSQSSIRAEIGSILNNAPASPPKSAFHPEVDEATLALGVGWTKLSTEDPDMQAAARGWARYLENHYSRRIHGAEIILQNRGLELYLVGCQEGFFLFQEDLLQGQLVGRTWDTCLQNLKSQPIKFEGTDLCRAERTPGPETDTNTKKAVVDNWADFGRLNRPVQGAALPGGVANGGMELD